MKEYILENIFKNIDKEGPLADSIRNRLNNFVEYTQLPLINQLEFINPKKLPPKAKNLYENIDEIINSHFNIAVELDSYKESGFLSSTLLQNYFKLSIQKDTVLSSVLYIDTNLILEDFKKLFNRESENSSPILVHSLDTLYQYIECADYVIWDKFTMMQGNYEFSKIYDILSIRYRKCLGNLFFISGSMDNMENQLNTEMLNVMNLALLLDLQQEQFIHMSGVVK